MADTLSQDDLQALREIQQHLSESGDPRAVKVQAYINSQPAAVTSGFHHGAPTLKGNAGAPSLPNTLLPLATATMVGGPILGEGAALLPLGKSATSAPSGGLPELGTVSRFVSHLIPGGRTMVRAYDAIRDLIPGESPTPSMPAPPVTFRPEPQIRPVAPPPVSFRPEPSATVMAPPPVSFRPEPTVQPVAPPPLGRVINAPPDAPRVVPPPALGRVINTPSAAPKMPIPPVTFRPTAEPELPGGTPEVPTIKSLNVNPISVPESKPQTVSSPESNLEPLPAIDKFEMNRMVHARAQELELPGSPAGKNAHPQLAQVARDVYGKPSWSQLSTNEMRQVYDFIDRTFRLPRKGELK